MSVVTRIRTSQELAVPFTPEEVWGVLADVAAYPDWWPAKLGVEILHHTGELLGTEFEVRPVMGRLFRIRVEEIEGTRSMRLRFFGGSLEGPGGFHLHALEGATQVRYEMDVFTRGLDVAVMSVVLPLESIHRSRMRSVLNSLAGRLKSLRKAADRKAAQEARSLDRESALRRQAEDEAARRRVAEEAERRAEKAAAARAAAEEGERRAAEEAAARAAAEEAERRPAEAEAKARAEEEGAHRAAEEAARKRAEEEAAARAAAEEANCQAAREAAALARDALSDVSGDLDHAEREGDVSTGPRLRPFWGRIMDWLREAPAAATPQALANEPADEPATLSKPTHFDIARLYLEALSSRATAEGIGQLFAPEAIHEEFPHRFLDAVVTRGLDGILEARTEALARFSSERYELTGATGGGSQVAMEVRWKGSVAATGEGYTAGQELDARIAFFLKFAGGKIVRQRTYACFEPWSTRAERMLTLDERVVQAGQSTKAPIHAPGQVPTAPLGSNFEIARNFLEALGARADAGTIARFFSVDAVQDECPNRLRPGGAHRDLQAIGLERSRGLNLVASETYELLGATGGGSQVALEVAWSGVVGDGMGLFVEGQKLEARLGIFLKFRDGLIVTQRNYICVPGVSGVKSTTR